MEEKKNLKEEMVLRLKPQPTKIRTVNKKCWSTIQTIEWRNKNQNENKNDATEAKSENKKAT